MSSPDPFQTHRPRLFGIAYRMLGTRSDADDVLQDAFLRWQAVDPATLQSTEAWLVTVVTRLAIDRLRAAKAERTAYIGLWLPEPLVQAQAPPADALLEHCDDLSMAFLVLLERLAPEERAALLMRQVFDHDYADIASLLDKSEAACRQLVHRARQRLQAAHPRFDVQATAHRQLLQRFVAAAQSGQRDDLMALFADDAELMGDGGGKVVSVGKVLHGADRIARLFHVVQRSHGSRLHYSFAQVNGQPGLLRWCDGCLRDLRRRARSHIDGIDSTEGGTARATVTSSKAKSPDGRRIHRLYVVRNPDKLQHIHLLPVTDAIRAAS